MKFQESTSARATNLRNRVPSVIGRWRRSNEGLMKLPYVARLTTSGAAPSARTIPSPGGLAKVCVAAAVVLLAATASGSPLSAPVDMDAPVPALVPATKMYVGGIACTASTCLTTLSDPRGRARVNSTLAGCWLSWSSATGIVIPGDFLEDGACDGMNVATNGTDFIVARNAGFQRISGARAILDPTPIPLGPNVDGAAAFDGTNYLVAARSGQRVSPAGVIVDPTPFEIIPTGESFSAPRAACGGGVCLVTWVSVSGSTRTARARLVANGVVQGAPFTLPIAAASARQDITFDGTQFVVFGQSAVAVSTTGVVGTPFAVGGNTSTYVTAGFDGTHHFAAWLDPGGLSAAYFDASGARTAIVGGTAGPRIPTTERPTTSCAAGRCFLAWEGGRGTRIVGGAVLDPTYPMLVPTGNNQRLPSAASDGTGFLVAWYDDRGRAVWGGSEDTWSGEIRAARLDANGRVEGASLRLSPTGRPWRYGSPRVAFGAGHYLVTWSEFDDNAVRAARVSTSGVVEDTTPLTLGGGRWTTVAFDGMNFLVVWTGLGGTRGVRVSPSGTVLDATPFSITSGGTMRAPAVAFDGENYVLAWSDAIPGDRRVLFTRISTAAVVLDFPYKVLSSLARDNVSGNEESVGHPALASFGGTTLIAWEDSRNVPSISNVYGTRVKNGVVLDPQGFAIGARASVEDDRPAVAYSPRDGKFIVAWESRKVLAMAPVSTPADVRTRLVDADGTLGPEGPLLDSPLGEEAPALAPRPAGPPLLVYSKFLTGASLNSYRVQARLMGEAADGGAGTDAGAADGGPLVDSSAVDGGSGALDGSTPGSEPPPGDDTSCACRVGPSSGSSETSGMALGVLALTAVIARRGWTKRNEGGLRAREG